MITDKYLKFPLGLLLHSADPVDYFENAELFAAVNAGIGFRKKHHDQEFQAKLDELEVEDCDEEAVIGASVCGINLKDETGQAAREVYETIADLCQGSPFVNIKASFFNAAYQSAQKESDNGLPYPDKWISWREYRVLLAIYSLQWNSRDYCEAGWETIRCRASGFHKKSSYREFEESEHPWPDHVVPISRDQTIRTIEKLEELKFFLRVRISSNPRHGGKYAYSIKHKSREDLIKDVESKQAYSRGDILRENRARDHLLLLKARADREARIGTNYANAEVIQAELENFKSTKKNQQKPPAKSHKNSKPASCQQEMHQETPQHNEKSSDEKYRGEKSTNEKYFNNNIPSEVALSVSEQVEDGYFYEGKFLKSADVSRIFTQKPDAWSQFKQAKRIKTHDGKERIELAA